MKMKRLIPRHQRPKADYWPAVESMVEADIGSVPELALRFAVVFFGAVFLTVASESFFIATWLAIFLLTNGYYSWLLFRIENPVSQSRYNCLVALFVISVALYTSCTVYLFQIGTPAFITIAIAALIAQSLFNLSRHRHSNLITFLDTVVVGGAGLYFGLSLVPTIQTGWADQMVIVVSTLGVCSYYVIAQHRKVQIHDALQISRHEAAQTQKMRAVGQLTAGVAHEFNNLLTVIRGNIELAQLTQDHAERNDRMNDAITAADRADALTSQLLSLSRKARLEATLIDLPTFWNGFKSVTPRISPATLSVDVIETAMARTLYCDINQLEVALINLVINARDAMQGQGNIKITSRRLSVQDQILLGITQADATNFNVIEVRDDGPGILPSDIQRVVEPFFTTKPVGEGTGLGLPMVKGFCEQSGGQFGIQSSPLGTRVVMALPIAPR